MSSNGGSKRVVVIGVGNELLRDEGVGIHIARALRQDLLGNDEVEVIEGGTSPEAFHPAIGADKLIIVDAAQGDGEPGTVYRLSPDTLAEKAGALTSLHQLGVLESLKMMELEGDQPQETVIIGIEPEEVNWGLELSPRLVEKLPRLVELVLTEIGLF